MFTSAPGHIVDYIEFIRGIYLHRCLLCAHEVIGICGIYMEFKENICCWHIYGYSMVKCKFQFVVFLLILSSGQISICNWAVVSWSLCVIIVIVVIVHGSSGYIIKGNNFLCGLFIGILPL